MRPKLVSLFSGTGALDMAVSAATGAETVAVADVCGDPTTKNWPHRTPCKSPCTILAHRFPGVPNLGDVSTVDWSDVDADMICAGFPCQDVSTAGRRAGLRDGTRTGLWSEVVRAIRELQPRLVVLENVPGIFTASASGDVEPCAWCLGDGADGHMRALHAVLADLAALGFDAEWTCVRASDVGAPHRRERWFLIAHPAGNPWRIDHGDAGVAGDADSPDVEGIGSGGLDVASVASGSRERGGAGSTSADSDILGHERPGQARKGRTGSSDGDQRSLTLLPTPAVNDMGKAYTPDEWDAWTAKMQAAHGNGNGHGKSLEIEAARLLPTPTTEPDTGNGHARNLGKEARLLPTPRSSDGEKGGPNQRGSSGDLMMPSAVHANFGQYAGAIQRWERAIGTDAPAPTEPTGKNGAHRLSPKFTEWMMGLPPGWITDVPGITRNEALKACGNGVVPQQAYAALTHMLAASEVAA